MELALWWAGLVACNRRRSSLCVGLWWRDDWQETKRQPITVSICYSKQEKNPCVPRPSKVWSEELHRGWQKYHVKTGSTTIINITSPRQYLVAPWHISYFDHAFGLRIYTCAFSFYPQGSYVVETHSLVPATVTTRCTSPALVLNSCLRGE